MLMTRPEIRKSSFPGRAMKNTRARLKTARRFLPPGRGAEVKRSHRRSSFCYAGTREHGKESLRRYTIRWSRRGYPVIAARRTNIPPGVLRQDFPLSWRTEGVSARFPDRISGRFEWAKRNRSPCEPTVRSA
jgi:hypothetical protein